MRSGSSLKLWSWITFPGSLLCDTLECTFKLLSPRAGPFSLVKVFPWVHLPFVFDSVSGRSPPLQQLWSHSQACQVSTVRFLFCVHRFQGPSRLGQLTRCLLHRFPRSCQLAPASPLFGDPTASVPGQPTCLPLVLGHLPTWHHARRGRGFPRRFWTSPSPCPWMIRPSGEWDLPSAGLGLTTKLSSGFPALCVRLSCPLSPESWTFTMTVLPWLLTFLLMPSQLL